MGTLTESTPKPMLKVAGKTLLEHKIDALPLQVDEVIIVIGHLGSVVRNHFGDSYGGKRILYVEQENPVGGTADALWKAKDILTDKFFVMNGDNIYARADLESCLAHEWVMLVQKKERIGRAAQVVVDERQHVVDVVENHKDIDGQGLINTALYLLDTRIFDYAQVPKAPGSTELGLPQTMLQAAKDITIQAVPATVWIEIKAPEDLQKAEDLLAKGSL